MSWFYWVLLIIWIVGIVYSIWYTLNNEEDEQ